MKKIFEYHWTLNTAESRFKCFTQNNVDDVDEDDVDDAWVELINFEVILRSTKSTVNGPNKTLRVEAKMAEWFRVHIPVSWACDSFWSLYLDSQDCIAIY